MTTVIACSACGTVGQHVDTDCPHTLHGSSQPVSLTAEYDAAGRRVLASSTAAAAASVIWTHPTSGAKLYVGSMPAAQDRHFLAAAEIRHVVNCIGSQNSFRVGEPVGGTVDGTVRWLQFPASCLLPPNEVFSVLLPGQLESTMVGDGSETLAKLRPESTTVDDAGISYAPVGGGVETKPPQTMLEKLDARKKAATPDDSTDSPGSPFRFLGMDQPTIRQVKALEAEKQQRGLEKKEEGEKEEEDSSAVAALAARVAARFQPYLVFVEAQLDAGENVLVHCVAGAHRASSAGTAWLMHKERVPLAEALAIARARRPVIDPYGFLGRLLELLEIGLGLAAQPSAATGGAPVHAAAQAVEDEAAVEVPAKEADPAAQTAAGCHPDARPGDWDCGVCGANVFASKSKCFKCKASKGERAALLRPGQTERPKPAKPRRPPRPNGPGPPHTSLFLSNIPIAVEGKRFRQLLAAAFEGYAVRDARLGAACVPPTMFTTAHLTAELLCVLRLPGTCMLIPPAFCSRYMAEPRVRITRNGFNHTVGHGWVERIALEKADEAVAAVDGRVDLGAGPVVVSRCSASDRRDALCPRIGLAARQQLQLGECFDSRGGGPAAETAVAEAAAGPPALEQPTADRVGEILWGLAAVGLRRGGAAAGAAAVGVVDGSPGAGGGSVSLARHFSTVRAAASQPHLAALEANLQAFGPACSSRVGLHSDSAAELAMDPAVSVAFVQPVGAEQEPPELAGLLQELGRPGACGLVAALVPASVDFDAVAAQLVCASPAGEAERCHPFAIEFSRPRYGVAGAARGGKWEPWQLIVVTAARPAGRVEGQTPSVLEVSLAHCCRLNCTARRVAARPTAPLTAAPTAAPTAWSDSPGGSMWCSSGTRHWTIWSRCCSSSMVRMAKSTGRSSSTGRSRSPSRSHDGRAPRRKTTPPLPPSHHPPSRQRRSPRSPRRQTWGAMTRPAGPSG